MRAYIYHGNNDLRRSELAEPHPGPGEVKVRIAYCGLCGTDLHEYFDGPLFIPTRPHPITGHSAPLVIGHEAAGTVDSVGEGVDEGLIGQQVAIEPAFRIPGDDGVYNRTGLFYGVMAPGCLAEFAIVPRQGVHEVPAGVSLRDAALAEPLAVGLHAVRRSNLAPGQAVAVFGGGAIGIACALGALTRKPSRVVVVEPAPHRREVLRGMGLEAVGPDAEVPPSDVVFDAAGVPAAFTAGLAATAPGGRLVVVAMHQRPVEFLPTTLMVGERSIISSLGYVDTFPEVLDLMARGAYPSDGWVDQIEFDQVVDGLTRLQRGDAVKVLVEVAP